MPDALPRRFQRLQLAPLLAVLLCSASCLAQTPGNAVTVNVQAYELRGNTLLSSAELSPALTPFKGPQTQAGLQRAVAAVQAAYRDAGWGAVVVTLPEQQLSAEAVVQVQVLEGRIATVALSGSPRWGEAALRALLPSLQTGQTPRITRIDREIQLLNEGGGPLVALTLETGERPGEVDARLQVQDTPDAGAQRWRVSLDNTGNSATGRLRLGLGWRDANWSAAGDSLSVQLQTSPTRPDRVVIGSVQYSRPLPEGLARLEAYAAASNVDGGSTPTAAGALSFAGSGHMAGLRLARLLESSGALNARLAVSVDQRAFRNSCAIAGLPAGACGAAGESVTVQPLTLELSAQPSEPSGSAFSLAWSHNLPLGGSHTSAAQFEAVRPGAPKGFDVWRGNAQLLARLGTQMRLLVRGAAQLTRDPLVSGEQFGLAAVSAVRGYAERELVGDSAAFASVEWLGPALNDSLTPSAFVDAGEARNRGATECRPGQTQCRLWSTGVGLRGSLAGGQWKADAARAGTAANTTERGDWRLHFNASWPF
jgi:hemolysin activation/secretion protein